LSGNKKNEQHVRDTLDLLKDEMKKADMDKYEEASRADKTITGKLYNTFMFANAATNVFGKVAAKSLGSALFPRNNRSATPAPAAAAAAAPASPGSESDGKKKPKPKQPFNSSNSVQEQRDAECAFWAKQLHTPSTSTIAALKLSHPSQMFYMYPIAEKKMKALFRPGEELRRDTYGMYIERTGPHPFESMVTTLNCFHDHLPAFYESGFKRVLWALDPTAGTGVATAKLKQGAVAGSAAPSEIELGLYNSTSTSTATEISVD